MPRLSLNPNIPDAAAFRCRRDPKFSLAAHKTPVGEILLESGLHDGGERRSGLLLAHICIQTGFQVVPDGDGRAPHDAKVAESY